MKRIIKIIGLLLPLVASVLTFVGGIFHPDTNFESRAIYAAEVVKNDTKEQKNICLSLSKKTNEGSFIDFDTEFFSLYGVFAQKRISFASIINANKKHTIVANSISDQNLSLVYGGGVGSSKYNKYYRHRILPIDVMFDDLDTYDVSKYKAYISVSHANKLLNSRNELKDKDGSFSSESYRSLIKNIITMTIDNEPCDFVIQNIYFENEYYYEGVNDVVGDFIITSYYLPHHLRDEQENLYFLNQYVYQNEYIMKYISNSYNSDFFNLGVNKYNLNGEIDEENITGFFSSRTKNKESQSNIMLISSAILLCFSFFIIVRFVLDGSRFINFSIIIFCIESFFIYVVFYFIGLRTNNKVLFSSVSTKFYAIEIFVFLILLIFASFLKKEKFESKRRIKELYYEVDL